MYSWSTPAWTLNSPQSFESLSGTTDNPSLLFSNNNNNSEQLWGMWRFDKRLNFSFWIIKQRVGLFSVTQSDGVYVFHDYIFPMLSTSSSLLSRSPVPHHRMERAISSCGMVAGWMRVGWTKVTGGPITLCHPEWVVLRWGKFIPGKGGDFDSELPLGASCFFPP